MSAYLDQFSAKMDVEDPGAIKRVLVVASSQRSGSSLLGRHLARTGLFGVPLEYLNKGNFRHWRDRFGVTTPLELLDRVEPLRTTSNGVFSLKAHYFQLAAFGSVHDLLARYGDCRFVRIVRRDIVGQAVSHVIARQTGVWISGQTATGEARYSSAEISRSLRQLSWQNSLWQIALSLNGQTYIDVFYEDLVADPHTELLRVARFMGIDDDAVRIPPDPPISRQNVSLAGQWLERFRSEFSERDEPYLVNARPVDEALKEVLKSVSRRGGKDTGRWPASPNLESGR